MNIPETMRYLSDLLSEYDKLRSFAPMLPHCFHLLKQEILRVIKLLRNVPVLEQNVPEQAALLALGGIHSNEGANNTRPSPFHSEMPGCSSNPSLSRFFVKKSLRIDMPAEKYPNYNFVVSRITSRMDYVRKIEDTTGCRVLVRGRGSIQDPEMLAALMGLPGSEHLKEAFHVLICAELPVQIIDSCVRQAFDLVNAFLNSLLPKGIPQDYHVQQHSMEPAPISGTRREMSSLNASATPFNMRHLG